MAAEKHKMTLSPQSVNSHFKGQGAVEDFFVGGSGVGDLADMSGDGASLNDLDEDCGGSITPYEIVAAEESTATPNRQIRMLHEEVSLEFD